MALKGNRHIRETDITMTLNDVAEPGVTLVYSTAGSGIALGDIAGVTSLSTSPYGKKVHGVLLQNFVNINQSLYHRNFHKDEQVIGERANVLRRGWVVTNKILGTPNPGDKAYLAASGLVTPTVDAGGGVTASPLVGEFAGLKDADGYAKLNVNLPTALT